MITILDCNLREPVHFFRDNPTENELQLAYEENHVGLGSDIQIYHKSMLKSGNIRRNKPIHIIFFNALCCLKRFPAMRSQAANVSL